MVPVVSSREARKRLWRAQLKTAPENSNCGLTRNVVLVNMNSRYCKLLFLCFSPQSRESYVVSPSADMTIEGANSILAMLQTASALHELGLSSEAVGDIRWSGTFFILASAVATLMTV